jgi:hypothetical protein
MNVPLGRNNVKLFAMASFSSVESFLMVDVPLLKGKLTREISE